MTGMWARLEDSLIALQRDRARMARYMLIAYWVSTSFVVLGAVLILLILTGRWSL